MYSNEEEETEEDEAANDDVEHVLDGSGSKVSLPPPSPCTFLEGEMEQGTDDTGSGTDEEINIPPLPSTLCGEDKGNTWTLDESKAAMSSPFILFGDAIKTLRVKLGDAE